MSEHCFYSESFQRFFKGCKLRHHVFWNTSLFEDMRITVEHFLLVKEWQNLRGFSAYIQEIAMDIVTI
jgi:hypothetical protein